MKLDELFMVIGAVMALVGFMPVLSTPLIIWLLADEDRTISRHNLGKLDTLVARGVLVSIAGFLLVAASLAIPTE